jgi:hypothetical protein
MNKFRDWLFAEPPTLTTQEQAEIDEQEWYDNFIGWCDYDENKNTCNSYKFLLSSETIIGKLFTMFNEFLYNNNNIIKLHKKKKNDTGSYYIKEEAAKEFITNVLTDDWNNYTLLNQYILNQSRVIIEPNTPYVLLDGFVYGFSKYNDLMKVVSFDEKPIQDMPIKPKDEPIQQNARVPKHTLQMSNATNATNTKDELINFEKYLKKTPQSKTTFITSVINKFRQKNVKRNSKPEPSVSKVEILIPYFNKMPNTLISTNVVENSTSNINVDYERPKINTSTFKKDMHGIIIDGGKKGTRVARKKPTSVKDKNKNEKKPNKPKKTKKDDKVKDTKKTIKMLSEPLSKK